MSTPLGIADDPLGLDAEQLDGGHAVRRVTPPRGGRRPSPAPRRCAAQNSPCRHCSHRVLRASSRWGPSSIAPRSPAPAATSGMVGQRGAQGRGHRRARLDRLDELEVGAVEVREHRGARPAARQRIELRGEVMEVAHVGLLGAGRREGRLPHRREVVGQLGLDRRQHHVGCVDPVLVRRMHRHRRGDCAAAGLEGVHRVGVVEVVHVECPRRTSGRGCRPPGGRGTRRRVTRPSPPRRAPATR